MPFKNVVVLYGHIHQENQHVAGHIPLYSAKGLMYPLPAPGSLPTAYNSLDALTHTKGSDSAVWQKVPEKQDIRNINLPGFLW